MDKKLEYYFNIAGLPIYGGISRTIKGKDYKFFIERTTKEDYERFWLWYYQKAIGLFVDFNVKGFKERMKGKKPIEVAGFIEAELKQVSEAANRHGFFSHGFDQRQRGVDIQKMKKIASADLKRHVVHPLIVGAAFYDLSIYLKEFLESQSNRQIDSQSPKLSDIPKLKWAASVKQCYDTFQQLKKEKWLDNTNDELAVIIHTMIKFKGSGPSRSTIATELGRGSRPIKPKRFRIPTKE